MPVFMDLLLMCWNEFRLIKRRISQLIPFIIIWMKKLTHRDFVEGNRN